MRLRRVAGVVVVGALAGCSAAPAPAPTFGSAGAVCSPRLLTDHVDTGLSATTAATSEPASPIPELIDVGVPVRCTALLTVGYATGSSATFDIALTDAPIADIAADLDAITGAEKWMRDPHATIWRDPDDPAHFIQAFEIEEGVLVGVTAAGFGDLDGP